MKKCLYCGRQYDDVIWKSWCSKYCCKECYRTGETKYRLGDKVYSYYNTKVGNYGMLTAVVTEGEISQVYKLHKPTTNGLYQYTVNYTNSKYNKRFSVYRFVHQIFDNKDDCTKYVNIINERRKINREAREKIKLFT